MSDKPDNQQKEFGEGNYKATRQYNEATKKFVDSGRVEDAAAKAKPENETEARAMDDAERAGKSRAKEEDPAVRAGSGDDQQGASKQERGHREARDDHDESAQTKERAQNRQQEGTGAAAGTTHNPATPRPR